ncbi:MAG: SUMF1/EgtB/PvdO family nonheme iron enzyme [Verrucomicrobia bacterium]|nr:SUMF1/EgtB/PvdO family nonheme iron enzyme [Verrucomicrobiota bacterium]
MSFRLTLPLLIVLLQQSASAGNPVDQSTANQIALINPDGLKRALDDIAASAPGRFPDPDGLRRRIAAIPDPKALAQRLQQGDPAAIEEARAVLALQREILLANPLLDFDRIIARKTDKPGLPANFHSNSSIPKTGFQNSIISFSLHGKGPDTTVFTPESTRFAGDFCLHFDATRLMFSMPNDHAWQVHEVKLDGSGLRQVSPDIREGVDNYDACYLPNGEVLFTSTLPMVSVPCVAGNAHVANLVRMSADGKIRQLCFDQEHNWCPRVLADGTILYQRWEYTDTPHSNTRLLMTMNPDGTNQRSFYGSNSYWPSAFFYATPVPGSATQVVGVSSGHHGDARLGELYLLDAALGRTEDTGVVRQFPSKPTTPSGKGRIYDHMRGVWPRFLHPQPLSGKYVITACQPSPKHGWGIYLADAFDNLLPLKELPGLCVLEPIPVIARPVPPVIPDKVNLAKKDATVYLQDIYEGPGLKGIPRGTVKALRVFSYTFSYHNVGGLYGVLGLDGPWDIHRPLGTVPVHPDGSAKFKVPANTPVSLQPLDENGQALAQMRSWMTAMPGEVLSCVGCHENHDSAPSSRGSIAFAAPAADLKPWRAKPAGFGFDREVQPVLDRHCSACHDGTKAQPDLRGGIAATDWSSKISGNGGANAGHFSTSYINLFPYTRSNGIEGDYHLLSPMEFHFSTTELGQLLRKGHHGVNLDADAMDRLATWVDLNRPYHGSWSSVKWGNAKQLESDRSKMRETYANVCENHEDLPPEPSPVEPILPAPLPPISNPKIAPAGWPFAATKARELQGTDAESVLEAGGVRIPLVRIPAGEFAMGSATGHRDEQPVSLARITQPFRMAKFEITNGQFRHYDPDHDSRVADALNYQFGQRPWSLNGDDQPVCRASFREAMAFCEWLSRQSGKKVTLPTEAQWEWAARAGSPGDFPFGDLSADYSTQANMADLSITRFAACTADQTYHAIRIVPDPNKFDLPLLYDPAHNDGHHLSTKPGSYLPNPFGLHDMHGNVAEWTRSHYLPYPYADDARNDPSAPGERVVRGGSWWNRPAQCTSSHRAVFQDYHPVMWVGFRVIVED